MTGREDTLRAARSRRGPGGFTLLELLVALVLVGLIAVMLTGGLRFGARVWEASRDQAQAVGEVTAVRGFVRERAMAVRPLRLRRPDGGLAGGLSGDRSHLQFVSRMPSYVSRGGLHHLSLSAGSGGVRLAWWPLGSAPGGAGSGERDVLAGASGVQVSYYGAPEARDPMAWRDDWPDGPALPRLLSIKVKFPDGDPRVWPELILFLPAAGSGIGASRGARSDVGP